MARGCLRSAKAVSASALRTGHPTWNAGMTVLATILIAVVAVGLLVALVQALAQRALIRAPLPAPPDEFPPVSVLRPLRGVDADLEENMRSLFRLDYPAFEVILGAEEHDDPALAVARRVAAEFPHVPSVIVSGAAAMGMNPKVNNLANLARRARHPLFLISDSNVRVTCDHLRRLAAERAAAGGGLVWAPARGVNGQGLGGRLEALELNGPMMGGASALMRLLKIPCAVGKSMLVHRTDVVAIGGFRFLGQFLAEDQVCAEELARRGRPVVVTGHLVDNVLGYRSLRDFVGRHLRWARLRRHVSLAGYLGEGILNPVFVALLGLAIVPSIESAVVAGAALAGMSAINIGTERMLGLRRSVWVHPLLELARSAIRGALWVIPLISRTVVWRGHALTVAARSRIEVRGSAATGPVIPRISARIALKNRLLHTKRSSRTRPLLASKGFQRSPRLDRRAGTLAKWKSSMARPRSISSQVTGVDTAAAGCGRTE